MTNVEWKNNRTPQSAILEHQELNLTDFYVRKSRVQSGEMPEYLYPVHELHLMTKGQIATKRHDSSGKIKVDSAHSERMCIVCAGQTVSAEWEDDLEMMIIGFTQCHLSRLSLELNFSDDIKLVETILSKDSLIESLGVALLQNEKKPTAMSKFYSDSISRTLMLHVIRNYTNSTRITRSVPKKLQPHKIRRATSFMKENLAGEFTIAEVAETVNLSYFHFIRAFRDAVGMTPQQYVIHHRLEAARALLSSSDLPLIDVCVRSGFQNQSHFTTLFRKIFGVTPNAWRKTTRPVSVPVSAISLHR